MSSSSNDTNDIKVIKKCLIFWDYENIRIPKNYSVINFINHLKLKIESTTNTDLSFEIMLYVGKNNISKLRLQDLRSNDVKCFVVESTKPESADKRILIDAASKLYELKYVKSIVFSLITGDKDFGHSLSRIQGLQVIDESITWIIS